MIISASTLSTLIVPVTTVVVLAPVVLLVLWLKDFKGGRLW